MIIIATNELQALKDELDDVKLEQKQGDKDLESQWAQTKMMIEPVVISNEETLDRKIGNQKNENQNLLKQLIELRKQHNILHSQIATCRAKVQ